MSDKLNYCVICFAPNDWWGMNPSCATHYMLRFSQETKVLYVNPFSSDIASVKKGLWKRIPRKLRSLVKFLRKPSKNLYVFSPVFMPFQGIKVFDRFNNWLLKCQMKLVIKGLGIRNPVVWLENIRAVDLLQHIYYTKILYHVSDRFTHNRYIKNKEALVERDQAATAKSDIIVAVSEKLFEWKSAHSNVQYLPHGVDFELFRKASLEKSVLDTIKDVKHPIVGYYGTLSSSNDIELWTHCASRLPNLSFVFAGKVTGGGYTALFDMPNVHHLGMLPYNQIPKLCASFDLCMLQWKMTPWIAACNPLKTMEYMASGNPIVSVPIDFIRENYSDVVSIAESREDYCKAIQWELENDTPDRKARRVEIARSRGWDQNYNNIKSWIADLLE